MEDEIDLRKYIDVLLRHWKLIVSITVIAVFVAGVVSFVIPPTYEARAAVLLTKVRSEITFTPEYRTVPQEDGASQRKGLIALVKSDIVATQVIEQLGDKLKPGERKTGSILSKVQTREQGDLIEILVKSSDPEKAAAIANAWANAYQNTVNALYSGFSQSPQEIQEQADSARKEYEEKQKAREDFITNSRIAELSQQVSDKKTLYDVKSLREQVAAGSTSSASAAANSLSLTLLQTRAFTSLPGQLQVSLDQLSSANPSLSDIDALIATLEARSESTPGQSISELRQQINQLKAELEQEKARQQELLSFRNIAWETLTTLESKAAEVKVATQAQDATVRAVGPASAPQSPVAPRRVMNIGIALVLGLIAGVFGAFGVEYFKNTGEAAEKEKSEGEIN